MIWSDFEFVIHLPCIIKTRILDIIWPCLLIIMIMTWLFSGAANDTTRAQINNIPKKSHVIPLLLYYLRGRYQNWAITFFSKLELKLGYMENKFLATVNPYLPHETNQAKSKSLIKLWWNCNNFYLKPDNHMNLFQGILGSSTFCQRSVRIGLFTAIIW